jgi:hypothetical protein
VTKALFLDHPVKPDDDPLKRIERKENAGIALINPLYPPRLVDFLKLGDTPRPPAGNILHLFFSNIAKLG